MSRRMKFGLRAVAPLAVTAIGAVLIWLVFRSVATNQWSTAIESGDLAEVKRQLTDGANPNAMVIASGNNGQQSVPSIIAAATAGQWGIVAALADAKASLDHKTADGQSLLMIAVQAQHANAVDDLLRRGTLPLDATDARGHTALSLAVRGNDQIALRLIDAGADVQIAEPDGSTPLHIAALRGNLLVVKSLISHGADVEAENDSGISAFMVSAEHSRLDVMKFLMEAGADPARMSTTGQMNALILAAGSPTGVEGVRQLLALGIDPNTPGYRGERALHAACEYGPVETVEMLLNAGADANTRTLDLETPLDLARQRPDAAGKQIVDRLNKSK